MSLEKSSITVRNPVGDPKSETVSLNSTLIDALGGSGGSYGGLGRFIVESNHSNIDYFEGFFEYLIQAYRESILGLEWMTDETKKKALVKLDKFTPKIGYPVKWRDYSNLEIDRNDLVGNIRRVAAFVTNIEVAKIGSPEIADNMRILYGGSVKSANIAEIMKKDDVDGALIGGASLDPEELAKIARYHRGE